MHACQPHTSRDADSVGSGFYRNKRGRPLGETQWVGRINDALREDHFCLYHQPIVSLKPNETRGEYCEVLVRLLDERGHLIPPGIFIPAAERYHRMAAIDGWVVRHSLEALRARSAAAFPLKCAINLSGQSLGEERFLPFVIDKLIQSGISPSRVCFEITETAAISNLSQALRFISSLRRRGCQFALDDFGMGLSSFAYLQTLPVDYIKIAGRFIAGMVAHPIDRAIVEGIQQIARVVGIKTVAESVQDYATLEKLKIMDVDYAQGNWMGRATLLKVQAA